MIISFARIQILKIDEEGFLKELTGQSGQKFIPDINEKFAAMIKNVMYLFKDGRNFWEQSCGIIIGLAILITYILSISLGSGYGPSQISIYTFIGLPIILYLSILFKFLITTYMKN